MTVALLDHHATSASVPECPVWCTNDRHPLAAERDMCDAGLGDRWHEGRIGSVVLPAPGFGSYDEEIGVELFRYDNADGTIDQLSVLIIYASEEEGEVGHVALNLTEARRLVDLARTKAGAAGCESRQVQFGDPAANNFLAKHPYGYLPCQFVMHIEGRQERMSLHRAQMESLGDLVACAVVLAEVAR
jgi:hypothetical protein